MTLGGISFRRRWCRFAGALARRLRYTATWKVRFGPSKFRFGPFGAVAWMFRFGAYDAVPSRLRPGASDTFIRECEAARLASIRKCEPCIVKAQEACALVKLKRPSVGRVLVLLARSTCASTSAMSRFVPARPRGSLDGTRRGDWLVHVGGGMTLVTARRNVAVVLTVGLGLTQFVGNVGRLPHCNMPMW